MGGVTKAETVKDFEFRLDSVLKNADLVYNFKATTKLILMQNLNFDDAIEEIEEEDE